MSLREEIENAMNETNGKLINTRLRNIADMVDMPEEEVHEIMKSLDFPDYVELMRALRDVNAEKAKEILNVDSDVDEAYSGGGTLSPAEMRSQGSATKQANTGAPSAQKAQSMQRLGKKNLGGATGQQAADALDKAGQGKALSPIQRKAMAAQASSVDALASDPRTAAQFRNLLNKINK